MGFPFRQLFPATLALVACAVGCGGGSSGGGQTVPKGPKPSASAAATPTPTPTPSPTPPVVGLSCQSNANPLPGTYVVVFTSGNVEGKTYTQNSASGSGTWNAAAYAATPTPVPTMIPTPTPTPPPQPHHTPKPTPTPTPTPLPTPTSTEPPTAYIAYSGAYTVSGFSGTGSSGRYTVSATAGCITLLTTVDGQPFSPGGTYNASGKGTPLFKTYLGVGSSPVASGNISSFTIAGLGATSGTGSFTLDNGATGTVTIQSSQSIPEDDARRIEERLQREPSFGSGEVR